MKYTTKSGKELPPEVVEVIEQEQARQREDGIVLTDKLTYTFGIDWSEVNKVFDKAFDKIYHNDDFAEFYKLYPKKDYDSYGNEIVKGGEYEFRDREDRDWKPREFICIAEKAEGKYIAYDINGKAVIMWKFCRKINSSNLKSELQTQMNDLLKQAKEIEAKINEL